MNDLDYSLFAASSPWALLAVAISMASGLYLATPKHIIKRTTLWLLITLGFTTAFFCFGHAIFFGFWGKFSSDLLVMFFLGMSAALAERTFKKVCGKSD